MGLVLLVGCELAVMYVVASAFQEEVPQLLNELAQRKAERIDLDERLHKQREKLAQLLIGEL